MVTFRFYVVSTVAFFLALAVVFVWGTNFVVIRWGLDGGMPPFLFATLRFALSALLRSSGFSPTA